MPQGMEGVARAEGVAAPCIEIAHGIGIEHLPLFGVADESIGGFGVLQSGNGLARFFCLEDFIELFAVRERAAAVGSLGNILQLDASGDDDGLLNGDLPRLEVYVLPCERTAFAEACARVVGDGKREEELMPGRKLTEDRGKLLAGECLDFLRRGGVFGNLDVLRGILGEVFAKVAGIDKGFFEYGANARHGGTGKSVLLGIVQELLEHLRADGAQLAITDSGADMVLEDGAIGAARILVRVDTHIVGEPFREKLRDRFLCRLDVAAVGFQRDERTGIGGFCLLARTAPGDFLALSVFAAADLDGIVPFGAAFSYVCHRMHLLPFCRLRAAIFTSFSRRCRQ